MELELAKYFLLRSISFWGVLVFDCFPNCQSMFHVSASSLKPIQLMPTKSVDFCKITCQSTQLSELHQPKNLQNRTSCMELMMLDFAIRLNFLDRQSNEMVFHISTAKIICYLQLASPSHIHHYHQPMLKSQIPY